MGITLLLLPDRVVESYWSSMDGASYDSTQACNVFGVENATNVIPGGCINDAQVD